MGSPVYLQALRSRTEYTPDLALSTVAAGIRACRQAPQGAGVQPDALQRCLNDAVSPNEIIAP